MEFFQHPGSFDQGGCVLPERVGDFSTARDKREDFPSTLINTEEPWGKAKSLPFQMDKQPVHILAAWACRAAHCVSDPNDVGIYVSAHQGRFIVKYWHMPN
jgi:hypothetical protein